DAERILLTTLEEKRRQLGEDHYQVGFSLRALGQLRMAQGRDREAETLFRRALDLSERNSGPSHFRNAEVMGDLAGALYEQGRFAEACSLYGDAVRLCDHALEPGAFVGTDASIGWGRSLEALGQKVRADSVLRAVVAFRRMNPHQWKGRLAES